MSTTKQFSLRSAFGPVAIGVVLFGGYLVISHVQNDFVFKYRPTTDAQKEIYNQMHTSLIDQQLKPIRDVTGNAHVQLSDIRETDREEIECFADHLAPYQFAIQNHGEIVRDRELTSLYNGQLLAQALVTILSCQHNPAAVPPLVMAFE